MADVEHGTVQDALQELAEGPLWEHYRRTRLLFPAVLTTPGHHYWVLTASNPLSEPRPAAWNSRANRQLSWRWHPVLGCSPSMDWVETSYAIPITADCLGSACAGCPTCIRALALELGQVGFFEVHFLQAETTVTLHATVGHRHEQLSDAVYRVSRDASG